jgi:hypothetical protein
VTLARACTIAADLDVIYAHKWIDPEQYKVAKARIRGSGFRRGQDSKPTASN